MFMGAGRYGAIRDVVVGYWNDDDMGAAQAVDKIVAATKSN
jgi:hypothetical protein